MKKILIVGGGIAGISLAKMLQDNEQYQLTLVEKGDTWRTIGYGVGIWKNTVKILKELDVFSELAPNLTPLKFGIIRNAGGKQLYKIPSTFFADKDMAYGVEREDLHKAITSKLDNIDLRFGTTPTSISQDDNRVVVEFNKGPSEGYDLVVGADGVHSTVRSLVFGKGHERKSGWRAWYFWNRLPEDIAGGYCANIETGEVIIQGSASGKAGVIFMCHDLSSDEELLFEKLKKYKINKQDVLSKGNDKGLGSTELVTIKMREWHKGRVVLLGDAKHSISPFSGLGTTLAIRDAYALAQELTKEQAIPTSLKSFAQKQSSKYRSLMPKVSLLSWLAHSESLAKSLLSQLVLPLIPDFISKMIIRVMYVEN